MTPLANAVNPAEIEYNRCQMRARSTVERCNGLLKMRWRCLLKHRVLHYKPLKASQIITACTVLHNMCVEYNVDLPRDEEENVEEFDFGMGVNLDDPGEAAPIVRGQNPILANARRLQQRLIRGEFRQ